MTDRYTIDLRKRALADKAGITHRQIAFAGEAVVPLARNGAKAQRAAQRVSGYMDLGGQATSRRSQRLSLDPLFRQPPACGVGPRWCRASGTCCLGR